MAGKLMCKTGRKQEQKVKKPEVTVGYYGVADVMVILGCGRTKAQDVIRQMNDELESKGYSRWPKGKISKTYFNQKYF